MCLCVCISCVYPGPGFRYVWKERPLPLHYRGAPVDVRLLVAPGRMLLRWFDSISCRWPTSEALASGPSRRVAWLTGSTIKSLNPSRLETGLETVVTGPWLRMSHVCSFATRRRAMAGIDFARRCGTFCQSTRLQPTASTSWRSVCGVKTKSI